MHSLSIAHTHTHTHHYIYICASQSNHRLKTQNTWATAGRHQHKVTKCLDTAFTWKNWEGFDFCIQNPHHSEFKLHENP